MSNIDASLIKKVREETGAGVMRVKQVLEQFDGDERTHHHHPKQDENIADMLTPRVTDPQPTQEVDHIGQWQERGYLHHGSGHQFTGPTGSREDQHRVQ